MLKSSMTIKKAVIAAGGWSTRFLPTVKTYAKVLVPILDKPQIQYLCDELIENGIDQICIVHRHGEKSLRNHFKANSELDQYLTKSGKSQYMDSLNRLFKKASFTLIPQSNSLPYGNGTPILSAKSFIGDDPFIYMYGDDLMIEKKPGSFLAKAISAFISKKADAVAAGQPVPMDQINRLSSVKIKAGTTNQIETVVEKPQPKDAFSNLALIGRFVFSPKIIKVLQDTAVARGELWLTDALNNMAQTHKVLVQSTDKNSYWHTTGDPLNFLKANLAMAFLDPKLKKELLAYTKSL